MGECTKQCCDMTDKCDLAYLEKGKCYTVKCARKEACAAVELRAEDKEAPPKIMFMDNFVDQLAIDEEEAHSKIFERTKE